MRRTREFRNIFFTSEGIEKSFNYFDKSLLTDLHKRYLVKELVIGLGELSWEFDTDEDLLRAYIPGITTIIYKKTFLDYEFMLYTAEHATYIGLKAQTLAKMVPIFRYVEALVSSNALTREQALSKVKPFLLVLHGRDSSWKELVSYLYVRQGLAVKPIEMNKSNLQLLKEIIAGAGKQNLLALIADGGVAARDRGWTDVIKNIAEMLGGEQIILLYPEGGRIEYWPADTRRIEFKPGHIKEAFWWVLRTIRERFTNSQI